MSPKKILSTIALTYVGGATILYLIGKKVTRDQLKAIHIEHDATMPKLFADCTEQAWKDADEEGDVYMMLTLLNDDILDTM